MSRPSRWHRLIQWIADRLYSWLPAECGVLARSGDVYCTLPENHDGPHGFAASQAERSER